MILIAMLLSLISPPKDCSAVDAEYWRAQDERLEAIGTAEYPAAMEKLYEVRERFRACHARG